MIGSAEEFVSLYESERREDYDRTVYDEAPEAVWHEIVGRYPDYKVAVVRNKTVPLSVLQRLVEDEDATVRYWIAMKRKAGSAILERLALDPEEMVRRRVASNAKTPISVLRLLLGDSVPGIVEVARERLNELGEEI